MSVLLAPRREATNSGGAESGPESIDTRALSGLCAFRPIHRGVARFTCSDTIDLAVDELLCPRCSALVSCPAIVNNERMRQGWRRRKRSERMKLFGALGTTS